MVTHTRQQLYYILEVCMAQTFTMNLREDIMVTESKWTTVLLGNIII